MFHRHSLPFGAEPGPDGTRFRLWAPNAQAVELCWRSAAGEPAYTAMTALGAGWYELTLAEAGPGTRYGFRIDGDLTVPDPAARYQPEGVHGLSEVVDPAAFAWPDSGWTGRPWAEAAIYELHVGTFTEQGSFAGVEAQLDALVELGVTAIELLPVADFPGRWNWGYDGVLLYAPARCYGRPEDLKALVAAAHGRGLMVFLDVVYNHFGPDGNYLHAYAGDFFTNRHPTPWGPGINFDGAGAQPVREFVIHNVLYWLEEFQIDGLRLDAIHAIADDSAEPILEELARRVRSGPGARRHIHLVVENDRNDAQLLRRDADGRAAAYDAQWDDDLHHVLHVLATGESDGYYADYQADPARDLGRGLAEGFVYQGEPSPFRGHKPRGQASAHLPPQAFVVFAQNHDQVGNRAQGERLGHLAPRAAVRAVAAIYLLAPQIPLLFMGEEFNASAPFLFFSDFDPKLQRKVYLGRKREFAEFRGFSKKLPDPGAPGTVARSTLAWGERQMAGHRDWLAWYKHLLDLRFREIVPLAKQIEHGGRYARGPGRSLRVDWPLPGGALTLVANPGSEPAELAVPAGRPILDAGEGTGGALAPWAVHWRVTGGGDGV